MIYKARKDRRKGDRKEGERKREREKSDLQDTSEGNLLQEVTLVYWISLTLKSNISAQDQTSFLSCTL